MAGSLADLWHTDGMTRLRANAKRSQGALLGLSATGEYAQQIRANAAAWSAAAVALDVAWRGSGLLTLVHDDCPWCGSPDIHTSGERRGAVKCGTCDKRWTDGDLYGERHADEQIQGRTAKAIRKDGGPVPDHVSGDSAYMGRGVWL